MSPASKTNNAASPSVAMHWFRKGLRLHDNPALLQSLDFISNPGNGSNTAKNANKFYAVYVLDGDSYQIRNTSPTRAQFLIDCLSDLDQSLQSLGSRLYVANGDPVEVLPKLWKDWNVTHLTWEADETGEPYAKQRDESISKLAEEHEIEVCFKPSETLFGMETYLDLVGGNPQKIPATMSGFQNLLGVAQRKNINKSITNPMDAPVAHQFPNQIHDTMKEQMLPPETPTDLPWPRNTPKEDLTVIWDKADCEDLTPLVRGGETIALEHLYKKVTSKPKYIASFDKPKTSCTSTTTSTTGLSPYLSLGCISPRKTWYTIADAIERAPANITRTKPPVSLHGQILWREFNYLIAHSANLQNPGTWGTMENNVYCRDVPWSNDPDLLEAWENGETGYPWIDACMIQLREEGWIHHLGRHAVACFLTRGDLWQSWEVGAAHFEAELLDADYALNGFNWLWLSCSGFFYQYFRCYSPVSFQKKNDKSGAYIRKWLPILSKLPDKYIYEPWKAPISVQKAAGFQIGVDYPRPIVEHGYVSKENMGKMALAYDLHKEKMNAAKQMKKSVKGAPAKKKRKVK